jgi:type II secretory pathway component PulC
MRKISIKNLFKKSESDTGKNNKAKMLILLLILIVTAGVIYWGYPLVFPDSAVKSPVASVTVISPVPTTVMPKAEVESVVKEKTEFEIEMKEREQGYKFKVFVYEPYKPPSNRNPFQKVRTSTPVEEVEEVEEVKEVKVLKFPKPELPPGTKLSGIVGSKDKKVAIIEMNGEIYIANLYDIISERYIVKEIKKDEVIIDFNGYLFSLKIGG